MCGTTARQQWKTPLRLTSTICRHSSGSYSQSTPFDPAMPALATRMSSPPEACATASAAAFTASASVWSTTWARAPSVAAAASTSAASRSQSHTVAPLARKRSATA